MEPLDSTTIPFATVGQDSALSPRRQTTIRHTARVTPTDGHDLRVRHALASEHDQLREIRLRSLANDPQAFAGTYAHALSQPSEWWERWAEQSELGDSQRTFVLEGDDGRWMGLALVRLADERPGNAVLNAMWVAPQARGRDAAGNLCEACAAWAAARGCRELTLTVVVDNRAARRAYEAAGFVVCGQTAWTGDGRTLEELMMVRSV
jgi:RimJ/RimL family protein N-acetyltransferase